MTFAGPVVRPVPVIDERYGRCPDAVGRRPSGGTIRAGRLCQDSGAWRADGRPAGHALTSRFSPPRRLGRQAIDAFRECPSPTSRRLAPCCAVAPCTGFEIEPLPPNERLPSRAMPEDPRAGRLRPRRRRVWARKRTGHTHPQASASASQLTTFASRQTRDFRSWIDCARGFRSRPAHGFSVRSLAFVRTNAPPSATCRRASSSRSASVRASSSSITTSPTVMLSHVAASALHCASTAGGSPAGHGRETGSPSVRSRYVREYRAPCHTLHPRPFLPLSLRLPIPVARPAGFDRAPSRLRLRQLSTRPRREFRIRPLPARGESPSTGALRLRSTCPWCFPPRHCPS